MPKIVTLEFTNLSDYIKQKYWKSVHARISNKKKMQELIVQLTLHICMLLNWEIEQ